MANDRSKSVGINEIAAENAARLLEEMKLYGVDTSREKLVRALFWGVSAPAAAGIEQVSYSTGPTLGNVEAGVVASLAGVRASIVSGGVLCVAGVAVAAALLPMYDAVRLAEEMIVLDHVSQGRVSYILGIGYRPVEYELYQLDYEERGAIADRKLERLLDVLRQASEATARRSNTLNFNCDRACYGSCYG